MIEVKRPFPKDEWFSVWNWIEQAQMWDALADDNVPRDVDSFCALQDAMDDVRQCWGVWRDGILGGVVSMEPDPLRPWIVHCHCLFRKEFWGRKTTIPALQLVASEIFDAGVKRIEMRVFESNRAIRALIPLLGGQEEGALRHQTQQSGKPIDMVVFGMSADEFAATIVKKSDILYLSQNDTDNKRCSHTALDSAGTWNPVKGVYTCCGRPVETVKKRG